MKKIIYAPVPEQQVIYIDRELAVINNDKVIYLKVNKLEDMEFLFYILTEWNIAEKHIEDIIEDIFRIYDDETE